MMKRILHKKQDGSVLITHPNEMLKTEQETELEFLERIRLENERGNPVLGSSEFVGYVELSDLPPREFRDSWEYDSIEKKIKENETKKQEILSKRNKVKNEDVLA